MYSSQGEDARRKEKEAKRMQPNTRSRKPSASPRPGVPRLRKPTPATIYEFMRVEQRGPH